MITAYDGSPVDNIDPTIGELKFYLKTWDSDDPELTGTRFYQLEHEMCDTSKFNDEHNNNPSSKFYQVSSTVANDLRTYGHKMRCLTPEAEKRVSLHGDYDTGKAANIMVVFEKCNPDGGKYECQGEEAIKNWSSFKFFGVLVNQSRFVKHLFGEERMQKRSEIRWFGVSHTTRRDFVLSIMRTTSWLNDSPLNLGYLNRE